MWFNYRQNILDYLCGSQKNINDIIYSENKIIMSHFLEYKLHTSLKKDFNIYKIYEFEVQKEFEDFFLFKKQKRVYFPFYISKLNLKKQISSRDLFNNNLRLLNLFFYFYFFKYFYLYFNNMVFTLMNVDFYIYNLQKYKNFKGEKINSYFLLNQLKQQINLLFINKRIRKFKKYDHLFFFEINKQTRFYISSLKLQCYKNKKILYNIINKIKKKNYFLRKFFKFRKKLKEKLNTENKEIKKLYNKYKFLVLKNFKLKKYYKKIQEKNQLKLYLYKKIRKNKNRIYNLKNNLENKSKNKLKKFIKQIHFYNKKLKISKIKNFNMFKFINGMVFLNKKYKSKYKKEILKNIKLYFILNKELINIRKKLYVKKKIKTKLSSINSRENFLKKIEFIKKINTFYLNHKKIK